jgi:hypothetical protein
LPAEEARNKNEILPAQYTLANMAPVSMSVNRSLGAQIGWALRDVPAGTSIDSAVESLGGQVRPPFPGRLTPIEFEAVHEVAHAA